MKPTLRIAARHALSAGLATSAWRMQGGATASSLRQAANGRCGISRNGGLSVKGQQCAYGGAGFSNMPRHEIDTPIYREAAM